MAEAFLQLSARDRREMLVAAAAASGRPNYLLEKDVWVVWTLATLFAASFGRHLVFKGGTSLSKAYAAIRRFSEDVDLTYDIRELIPDMVGDRADALPPNRSQEKRWSRMVRDRLPEWIGSSVLPALQQAIDQDRLPATLRADGDKVFVDYEVLATGPGYVDPSVMLEFGARSTGEPCDVREITCDAARHLDELAFPVASPRVMRIERTFWEKAIAVHVRCLGGKFRGERTARHWHDLVRLDEAGYAEAALRDRDLALAVARHQTVFFAEKDADGRPIDYEAAVTGALRLVPEGRVRELVADDYREMLKHEFMLDRPEPFEALIEACRDLERRANS